MKLLYLPNKKDSKFIWARRPAPPLLPAEPLPPNSPSPPVLSRLDTKLDTAIMEPSSSSLPNVGTERNDSQWEIGECISYGNVGPISPESIEGYRQFIAFHDTRSKYLFCYPVPFSTIYSGSYDSSSAEVSNCAYSSAKANQFYGDNQCRHQSSAPYQQWQNAVERDIQTILSNVSATLRGQDFMRADIWAHALTHWTRLHNAFSPCRPTGHTSAYP